MYHIEYFCPRQAPIWQILTEGLIWKTPKMFQSFQQAQQACNGLLWQYHSARVIDGQGNIVYSV